MYTYILFPDFYVLSILSYASEFKILIREVVFIKSKEESKQRFVEMSLTVSSILLIS